MNKTFVSALAAGVILGSALAASAQDRHHRMMGFGHGGMDDASPMSMMLEKADTDGDGKITAEEYAAAAKARFDAADTDGNGQLSVDEMVAAAEARREEMRKAREARRMAAFIDRRDTNDDGQLSFDEMTPGDADGRFFERFDRNGDGAITADELRRAMRDHEAYRPGRDEKRRGN